MILKKVLIYILFLFTEKKLVIKVIFHENCDNQIKIDFEKKIQLKTNHSWVELPEYLMLNNYGKYIFFLSNYFL